MTTWQRYHHGENRDEKRKSRRERDRERSCPAIEGCWKCETHSVQVGGWPLRRWQQRMLMNAGNRKPMFGLMRLHPRVTRCLTLFEQHRPHSPWKCHDVLLKLLARAVDPCVAKVQRALGLSSAGVITHPSVERSPVYNSPRGVIQFYLSVLLWSRWCRGRARGQMCYFMDYNCVGVRVRVKWNLCQLNAAFIGCVLHSMITFFAAEWTRPRNTLMHVSYTTWPLTHTVTFIQHLKLRFDTRH